MGILVDRQRVRSFSLSEDADGCNVTADFKDGVLQVHLPKSVKAKPKAVEIKIGEYFADLWGVGEGFVRTCDDGVLLTLHPTATSETQYYGSCEGKYPA